MCSCELREGLDHQQAELLSRAEAERLVNNYAVESTAWVLDTINDMVKR